MAQSSSPSHDRCVNDVESILSSTPRLHRLVDSIEALGCTIPNAWIKCTPCDSLGSMKLSGGFTLSSLSSSSSPTPTIIICENEPMSRTVLEDTLMHELVHAYDVCRTKIDWTNCLHHACTEVRASRLSGECDLSRELGRGHMQMRGGMGACVKRRAIKSVSYNPSCSGVAREAVETVFERCFRDREPFGDED